MYIHQVKRLQIINNDNNQNGHNKNRTIFTSLFQRKPGVHVRISMCLAPAKCANESSYKTSYTSILSLHHSQELCLLHEDSDRAPHIFLFLYRLSECRIC